MSTARRIAEAYGRDAAEERRLRIEAYVPLLGQMARRYASILPHDAVGVDELLSWGAIGLCRAIDTYDAGRGVPLEAFVRLHIRHAMVDGLREADRLPRRAREKERRYRAVLAELEQVLGREPTEAELAAALGGPESLAEHERAVAFSTLGSLDEPAGGGEGTPEESEPSARLALLAGDDPSADPEDRLLRDERHAMLVRALERLTERERQILLAVYDGDFTLTEIAQAMGLSVSYVARLHRHALLRVRAMMVHADHGPRRARDALAERNAGRTRAAGGPRPPEGGSTPPRSAPGPPRLGADRVGRPPGEGAKGGNGP